ncbi:MAG: hypothetical protein ABI896_03090 [Actinomycetota bacterium]
MRVRLLLVGLVAALLLGVVKAGATASAAPARVGVNENWIFLSSDRDGETRIYSIGEDGSRLSPLLPPGRWFAPVLVSRDGNTIVYLGHPERDVPAIYVSRADGSGFHRLVRKGLDPAFSPDGRLIAFTTGRGIWVVGIDGRGLRRLTSRDDKAFDWSPNGKALVFVRAIAKNPYGGGRYAVVVQPLRGKAHVIVRIGKNEDDNQELYQPKWSPSGRWIAYLNVEDNRRKNGLTVVRPNGKHRHRVVLGTGDALDGGDELTFAWSPDGRGLAYENGSALNYILPSGKSHKISAHAQGPVVWSPDGRRLVFVVRAGGPGDIAVARADGRGLKRLHLGLSGMSSIGLTWSPDGSHIAFAGSTGGDPDQIWVVGSDGQGLRRLTYAGTNSPVGWTRLTPVLPPAPPLPPTELVLDARTVATSSSVSALSGDGLRVAFALRTGVTDCEHVVAWVPGGELIRLGTLRAPCPHYDGSITSLALGGSRAAWLSSSPEDDRCGFALKSATLADPVPLVVNAGEIYGGSCQSRDIDHLRGDGDLLVFNDEAEHPKWLVQIGVGVRKCGEVVCTTLRKGRQAAPVDSVSGALIATGEHAAVAVLDNHGALVRSFRFTPADVYAARLDGGRLVVARSYAVESYDVVTGAQVLSRPIPAGYQLTDVDGGIAVLRRTESVILLRLSDGASLTFTPGQGPVLADLEPPGLYYSYGTEDGGGRVIFVPRAELFRQLGGGS